MCELFSIVCKELTIRRDEDGAMQDTINNAR
jgi:hypothetical protein